LRFAVVATPTLLVAALEPAFFAGAFFAVVFFAGAFFTAAFDVDFLDADAFFVTIIPLPARFMELSSSEYSQLAPKI
jgi:hypothetical protein